MNPTHPLPLALVCGLATTAYANPEVLVWQKPALEAGARTHTYFNASTGERIVTLLPDDVRPAESAGGSPPVWISQNTPPCVEVGNRAHMGRGTDPTDFVIALDWGDIANDTVIDCIGIGYSSRHVDSDTDGDTVGDGVPGFGATWTFYDADNGFNDCHRLGLVSLTLFNLQGAVGPLPPGQIASFTGTIDLGGAASLIFEIGDSDGDLNGAVVHNPGIFNTGGDRDGDGLADFSYAQSFHQPGTMDFDGDTILDGDPDAAALATFPFGMPEGSFVGDTFVFDPPPQGQGATNEWDLFDETGYVGTFSGGGDCVPRTRGIPNFGQWAITLFGYGIVKPLCPADLFPPTAPDGVLNFLDLTQFLTDFAALDPSTDLFPVGAPDGVFNFLDLGEYLNQFGAGCP